MREVFPVECSCISRTITCMSLIHTFTLESISNVDSCQITSETRDGFVLPFLIADGHSDKICSRIRRFYVNGRYFKQRDGRSSVGHLGKFLSAGYFRSPELACPLFSCSGVLALCDRHRTLIFSSDKRRFLTVRHSSVRSFGLSSAPSLERSFGRSSLHRAFIIMNIYNNSGTGCRRMPADM